MPKIDQKSPSVQTEAAKRAQRLAEELRANLRKRKEKARSADADARPQPAPDDGVGERE
jgi:hypothetical protein